MKPIPIPPPSKGVRADLDPEDVSEDELVAAENVFVRDGDFRVRPGLELFASDVNQRPMKYIQYDHGTSPKVALGTDRGWWVLAGNAWVDISGTALTADDVEHVPVFRTFNKAGITYLLGVNNKDSMKKWNGNDLTYSGVGGSPPIARTMMTIFDRVVIGNITSGPNASPTTVDVSANKDFDTGWGTELVLTLSESAGPIVSMQEFGELNGSIIKSDSVHMLIAQGGNSPFRREMIKNEISGPASEPLVFRTKRGEVGWLGNDGLVSMFNGASIELLPYHIQKQILKSCNPQHLNAGWATYDPERRELWLIYPLLGSNVPNGGLMINMGTLSAYPVRFPGFTITAGAKVKSETGITLGDLTMPVGNMTMTIGELGNASAIRRMVMGDIGGKSYQDLAVTDDGAAIPFYWETPVRGEMERYKNFAKVRHRFKPTTVDQNVSFFVGKRNEAGPVTFGSAHTMNLNVSAGKRKSTGHRTSSEYFSMKYSGDASTEIVYQGAAAYIGPGARR